MLTAESICETGGPTGNAQSDVPHPMESWRTEIVLAAVKVCEKLICTYPFVEEQGRDCPFSPWEGVRRVWQSDETGYD